MSVKLLKVFFATLLVLFTPFVIRIYTYDAYHFWSLNDPLNARYSSNVRIQNAAFINHLNFDSIILGNSHMENTSAKEASEIFGGKFFNLSMSGSNNYERSIVLKRALETHDIKRVILLLTPSYSTQGHGSYPIETWEILYDSNRFNDFKYYLNTHDMVCMWTLSKKSSCLGKKKSLDRPYAWFEVPDHASRFGGLQNWARFYKNPQLENLITHEIPDATNKALSIGTPLSDKEMDEISQSLDQTVFDFARQYPDTEFLLYFNPDSILGKALTFRNLLSVSQYSYFVQQAVKKSDTFSNVHLFGFDNLTFTNDISYYKDTTHYREDINSQLLHLMKAKKYSLSVENVDSYLNELWVRVENFDLNTLNQSLQSKLPD
ncbi:hypothetical protein M3080_03415 [Parasutterella secunda]|uniref:hypothetical protein n=1 Tax=Parasutterella secunda TaxID=626947 RepID=UPI002010FF42|nr:hypothetical protein [Parasutterella secunda]MCL1596417.1 hypothetical protein [Parasutterella secunda]